MSVNLLREYVTLVVEKIRTKKGQKGSMGEKFDLQKFKNLPDARTMLAYASKFLQKLGEGGSSRAAFLMSSKYVLKIALNDKGIGQNESEHNTYLLSNGSPVITKIYAADNENRWLIVDLVKELSDPNEFSSLANTDWKDFKATVLDHLGKRGKKLMKPDAFAQKVIDLAKAHNLLPGDINRIEHWGKTPDGRVILLDYGLTRQVWDTHYADDNQLPHAKTAPADAKTMAPNKGQSKANDMDKTDAAERKTKEVPYADRGMNPRTGKNTFGHDLEKTVAPKKRTPETKPSRYAPDEEKTKR